MENFPNLAKEIDFQEVQEAQRVPKKLDPKKHTPRHIIIHYPRLKIRRESYKQQEKRRQSPTKEFPLDYQLISQTLQARRSWKEVFKVMKSRTYNQDYSIQQSYHLGWKDR